MNQDPNIQMLGESENYAVWVSRENDTNDLIYHVEVGNITLHFFQDEWDEFVDVMMQAMR